MHIYNIFLLSYGISYLVGPPIGPSEWTTQTHPSYLHVSYRVLIDPDGVNHWFDVQLYFFI